MCYYEVVPLKIVHGSDGVLTYQSETIYSEGTIVTVPVGTQTIVGVIIRQVAKPSFATKPILTRVESIPLPSGLVALAQWMSMFYATHPVTVWQSLLPRGLTKTRHTLSQKASHPSRNRTNIVLNDEQRQAITSIMNESSGTSLVHGITGSGKTHIYIELAKKTVADGRSVIILVPEIALTSQLIAEFTPHFPAVVITHSTMTESARHTIWRQILTATSPQVVIGPRSALFSPVSSLGLIVIDECHEMTFKQEQSPRYSALRAASILSSKSDARLILGSATPSIADYYLATLSHRPIITLTKPARSGTVRPTVTLVDMTKKLNFSRHNLFSNDMLAAINATLEHKHQVLIFHNRRGTAPTTLCENCGWNALCPRCYVPLTLHADRFALDCHICGLHERVPTSCPECGEAHIIHKGIGTKLIHHELTKLFPAARIMRFDGDNDNDNTLDKHYQALYDGEIDIIIGTQVVAKGLDLPLLRMVGVVQADAGLALPDYLSSERTFQLLAQVTGRVGRNEHPSTVVVQSYQPAHPAVHYGITSDYASFYDMTVAERKRSHFPPFTHLLKLVCIYKTESTAIRNAQNLARDLRRSVPARVELLGPTPAFYERIRDTYRWQLVVKSPIRDDLVAIVQQLPAQHWQFELDPASLL
ncbi:primosomal protein N' [Candidatus Saccharibacteria bacterium]|nr:primosomal protein N' [Candidatus Saccharibacteria bacterium]